MALELSSSAFEQNGTVPRKYTCDGKDVSPPLAWTGPPSGTQSFALITDDPDAPGGTWVHWVIYDLPASARSLADAVPSVPRLDDGAVQGTNDFKKLGYGGPCPPKGGAHRYFFKLYALDRKVTLQPGASKAQLVQAMKGHILAEAQLVGLYKR
jgi:Raf kinase inhibitor-like YbhB/YbcL family protein